ncbi:MAG: FAD-dependent monooxygenase [Gammaproteobacteria bacterium]|tara:strand:+ start:3962 stop:5140 length:1179 start_codon:yes stop_codon:yes gene_type:complete
MKILIVGAGIGGLVSALCLNKKGYEVEIYEQSEVLSELGAGVQLSPNATRVLDYLELTDDLKPHVFEPRSFQFLNYKTEKIISKRDLGSKIQDDFGFPNFDVHRADLQKVLLNKVEEKGIKIYSNMKVIDVGNEENKAYIKINEEKIKADIVIGADGIHSVVREKLFEKKESSFTGNVAWRMLIPVDLLPRDLILPDTTVWLGPKKHFVSYHVSGGKNLNCVCLVEQEGWKNESWSERGNIEDLREVYNGWNQTIETLLKIANPNTLYRWALHDRPPMKQWSKGRIILLGDAAHPMLPFLAQGAAMAIEDGAVLADCISSYEDNEKSLKYFEQIRKPRTSFVQLAARRNAKILHLSGLAAFFRNIVMGYAGNKIFNKLYSYDALSAVNSKEI